MRLRFLEAHFLFLNRKETKHRMNTNQKDTRERKAPLARRALAILLSVLMLLGAMPLFSSAATIVDSGTCGDNLTWTLDSDGLLTISGSGAMEDYSFNYGPVSYSNAPWSGSVPKAARVKNVVIKEDWIEKLNFK